MLLMGNRVESKSEDWDKGAFLKAKREAAEKKAGVDKKREE